VDFQRPGQDLPIMRDSERLFPTSRLFGQYHLKYLGETTVHEIDCPSGAFFMVARRVIDEIGLLDEDFFMYAEDIDWRTG
jgi:GT2 family glycosyltransferase